MEEKIIKIQHPQKHNFENASFVLTGLKTLMAFPSYSQEVEQALKKKAKMQISSPTSFKKPLKISLQMK